MTEDQEDVNDTTTAGRHNGLQSGEAPKKRLKVTVLRVAVVLNAALIVAYVFDGIVIIWSTIEKTKAPQSTTTSPGTTCTNYTIHCDDGWELHGTKCYSFSPATTKLSWNKSRENCKSFSADLVKIESREEQKFLFYKLRKLMSEGEDKFWIGLTDSQTEGQWLWTDGSPLNQSLTFWFQNGNKKEPDNWTDNNTFPGGEDCVRMGEKDKVYEEKCWFDQFCNKQNRFICEKNFTKSPTCEQ